MIVQARTLAVLFTFPGKDRSPTAARTAIPELKKLIVELNEQCKRGEYPAGELNNRRTGAVAEAINAIETATTRPELRHITK